MQHHRYITVTSLATLYRSCSVGCIFSEQRTHCQCRTQRQLVMMQHWCATHTCTCTCTYNYMICAECNNWVNIFSHPAKLRGFQDHAPHERASCDCSPAGYGLRMVREVMPLPHTWAETNIHIHILLSRYSKMVLIGGLIYSKDICHILH